VSGGWRVGQEQVAVAWTKAFGGKMESGGKK
jgi:hypothetical protein